MKKYVSSLSGKTLIKKSSEELQLIIKMDYLSMEVPYIIYY